MAKRSTVVTMPAGVPQAPADLLEHGADLWRQVLVEYRLDSRPARELLAQACRAADRAQQLAEQIAKDGTTIATKTGALRPHPALAAELGNRALVIRTLQKLGFFQEQPRANGRPASGVGWRPPGGWR